MALQKDVGALAYIICIFIILGPWIILYVCLSLGGPGWDYTLCLFLAGGDLDNALCLFSLGPLDYKNFFVVSRLETLDYLY